MWLARWGGSSTEGDALSDRFAFGLAALIVVLILADVVANGAAASLFLVRKIAALVEYLAFWR